MDLHSWDFPSEKTAQAKPAVLKYTFGVADSSQLARLQKAQKSRRHNGIEESRSRAPKDFYFEAHFSGPEPISRWHDTAQLVRPVDGSPLF